MSTAHSDLFRPAVLAACLCFALQAAAQTPVVSADDQTAIRDLSARYAQALGGCNAEAFADLFAAETGYFASGFRGHFQGRRQLIALVQSERHCTSNPPAVRPGGNVPAVELDASNAAVRGVVRLGTAEYEDTYIKTPAGWRFESRTVVINAEKAAGLDAADLLAINRLGGAELVEYYEADQGGTQRLMTVGTRITVVDGAVRGRVFVRGGGYRDEVYEERSAGQWRVKSSTAQ